MLHAALQRLGLTRALQTAAVELAAVARTLEAGSPQDTAGVGVDPQQLPQQEQVTAGAAGAATREVAAAALSAARQAQQACAEMQRALTLHSVHHGDATAAAGVVGVAVAAAADQRYEERAESSCSCSNNLVALAAELEALQVKAAKAIAYGRHRAGQYEHVLLQGSTSVAAGQRDQARLQVLQGGNDRQAAGAASEEAAVAGFRSFWASVEKQMARLLGACHKASASASASAAKATAVGAILQATALRHDPASPTHLQPLPALDGPIAAASRTPINAARRTPPRASNAALQVGMHRRLVCAVPEWGWIGVEA